MKKNWINPKYTALAGVLLAAAAIKAWIITSGAVPFNSDEAIVALMARHILQGESPVFFYGQAYMGSLDAYLIALGFAIWGESIWVIRLVQAVLYMFTVGTTFVLAEGIFKSWKAGTAAGLLMAIPAVNTTLYTTATLGGYGEAILIGNLILIVTLRIASNLRSISPGISETDHQVIRPNWLGWFLAWGILTGLGLWVFGLTFVYTVPAFLLLLWWVDKPLLKRNQILITGWIAAAGAGFLIGAEPWWTYAFAHGLDRLISEVSGAVVAVERSTFLLKTTSHLVNYFLLGLPALLGLRPPWEVRWLVLPLIPLVLLFWGTVIHWAIRKLSQKDANPGVWLLAVVVTAQFLLFIFTPFGIDPSGRYFLPLVVPLSILAGGFVHSLRGKTRLWGAVGLAVVVLFQLGGNIDSVLRNPPGLSTQFNYETLYNHAYDEDLVNFLRSKGETRGYTNYWVSYPLAYSSQEDLIFVPSLPYHENLDYTERDNRYPPYNNLVKNSARTAYITVNHPKLDDVIRAGLLKAGVTWEETAIGDFRVFYGLSRAVHPDELGLGVNTP